MFKYYTAFNPTKGVVEINFDGEFLEEHLEAYQNFIGKYRVEKLIVDVRGKKLKHKELRVCRFCQKRHPEVTFRKTAHLLPQLLGNTHLITDFECDSCNQLFSKYENDLAHYLGMGRTFAGINAKNGFPKFTSADKRIQIGKKLEGVETENLALISSLEQDENVIIDEVGKSITITSKKHQYKPINVYKALLKAGLSLLDENELRYVEVGRRLLITSDLDEKMQGAPFFKVVIQYMPGSLIPLPLVFSCVKTDPSSYIPTRTFVVYCNNYIFQFFLPFDERDKILDGKSISFNIMPPLIDKHFVKKFSRPSLRIVDFSGSSIIKGEEEVLRFKFDSISAPRTI